MQARRFTSLIDGRMAIRKKKRRQNQKPKTQKLVGAGFKLAYPHKIDFLHNQHIKIDIVFGHKQPLRILIRRGKTDVCVRTLVKVSQ
jgi:hypothetical protein